MVNQPPRFEDALREAAEKQADEAVKAGLAGWWARADENQKLAVAGLGAAAALGPLGQGLLAALGVLYGDPAIPSAKQIGAVFWLFVITLPVAAYVLAVVLLLGRASGPVLLILAGVAGYFGGVVMAEISIPDQLGDFYCYAEFQSGGVSYEEQCRTFDELGFTTSAAPSVGSPSRSPDVFRWAVIYTAEARGMVMVVASIVASVSAGYLIRRNAG